MSVLKISITGPESSGKSELAQTLAHHFHTSFAPEYARRFLEKTQGRYDYNDLDKIAKGQIKYEQKAMKSANRVCFFDTDMLVLKIWSEFRFGKLSPFIASAYKQNTYDHYLLCKPDIGWYPDEFRESPHQAERDKLFDLYEKELKEKRASYFVVKGCGNERVQRAIDFIDNISGL